jgi:hypothetical protein
MTRPPLPDAWFSFGKHRGALVSTVAQRAPCYLLWVASIWATRADPQLWSAVKAHLPLAIKLLEQRDEAERAELERRRTRRLQLRASQKCGGQEYPTDRNPGLQIRIEDLV